MPKLTVQNAEIKTATVEVKTLTLSGKQVTLSVFKQIEEADVFQLDGSLVGEPWGRVNYHPDATCKTGGQHFHVVWQLANDLRRSAIPSSKRRLLPQQLFSEDLNRYLAACLLAAADGDPGAFDGWSSPVEDPRNSVGLPKSFVSSGYGGSTLSESSIAGMQVVGVLPDRARDTYRNLRHGVPATESDVAKLRDLVRSWNQTIPALRIAAVRAAEQEVQRRTVAERSHDLLLGLPQLFIAV